MNEKELVIELVHLIHISLRLHIFYEIQIFMTTHRSKMILHSVLNALEINRIAEILVRIPFRFPVHELCKAVSEFQLPLLY